MGVSRTAVDGDYRDAAAAEGGARRRRGRRRRRGSLVAPKFNVDAANANDTLGDDEVVVAQVGREVIALPRE